MAWVSAGCFQFEFYGWHDTISTISVLYFSFRHFKSYHRRQNKTRTDFQSCHTNANANKLIVMAIEHRTEASPSRSVSLSCARNAVCICFCIHFCSNGCNYMASEMSNTTNTWLVAGSKSTIFRPLMNGFVSFCRRCMAKCGRWTNTSNNTNIHNNEREKNAFGICKAKATKSSKNSSKNVQTARICLAAKFPFPNALHFRFPAFYIFIKFTIMKCKKVGQV